jgi:hypothetical protein
MAPSTSILGRLGRGRRHSFGGHNAPWIARIPETGLIQRNAVWRFRMYEFGPSNADYGPVQERTMSYIVEVLRQERRNITTSSLRSSTTSRIIRIAAITRRKI